LSVKAKDMSNNRLYPFYRDNLEKIIRDCHSIIYENEIVLIIRRKNRNFFSETALDDVQNYLNDNKLIGGLSYYFEDIVMLKNYFQQSIKAMELGIRLNPEKNLYFYHDYMPYHFFDMTENVMGNLNSFINPLIKQLSDYDKKNNSSYTTSLEVYLKNGSKLLNASKKLNIHRNTMDYHIHKINDILKIDVNEPKISQSLLISFMVLEYINAKH
jgi:sugar diacid utilization regulator